MPLGDTTATWDRPDDENDDLEDDVEDEPEARPRPTAGSRAVFVAGAARARVESQGSMLYEMPPCRRSAPHLS